MIIIIIIVIIIIFIIIIIIITIIIIVAIIYIQFDDFPHRGSTSMSDIKGGDYLLDQLFENLS